MTSNTIKRLGYKKFSLDGAELVWIPDNLMLIENDPVLDEALLIYNDQSCLDIVEASNDPEYKNRVDKALYSLEMIANDIELYQKHIIQYLQNRKLCSLELNLAYACNLRCRYCFADDGCYGKSGIMSQEVAKKAVDFLFKYCGEDEERVYIAFFRRKTVIKYRSHEIRPRIC